MNIFHYHYWTNLVEETEKFYVENGFEVTGRFAKVKGGIKTYHPPLNWEDFREENPIFRIIEVRKGKVNVTFGEGKKPMFDHIGFLVMKGDYDNICKRARELGWNVSEGERRTFIGTPIRLRIELQQHDDVVENGTEYISNVVIKVKDLVNLNVQDFSYLLGKNARVLKFVQSDHLALNKVTIKGDLNGIVTDPNDVNIKFEIA